MPLQSPFTNDDTVSLQVFESPHLRGITDTRPGRRVWCVVEQFAQPDIDELLNCSDPAQSTFCSVLDYDGIALVMTEKDGQTQLHILRTLHASVPIYIASAPQQIFMSWDFMQCAERAAFQIDLDVSRRFIIDGPTLSNSTILQGISLLAGGQVVCWPDGKLQIESPAAIPRFLSSEFSQGADAAPYFLELIAETVRLRLAKANAAALELSGGQDSSCVAAALDQLGRSNFPTYGLIHDGVAGQQQAQRRDELIQRFKFSDTTRPSTSGEPFSLFLKQTDARHVPCDEIYRRGIETCLDALPMAPDLVITGIGGDELTIVDRSNPPPATSRVYEMLLGGSPPLGAEIPSVASISAVESSFCRADMFLSRGIWPLNPLVSPAVVHLCQSLPNSIKHGRLLNKIALAKAGLSDFFLFPRYRENFAEVYENELRRFDLAGYLRDSKLHSLGIVDTTELIKQHVLFVNTGGCEVPLVLFANSVRLEQVLRTIA